MCKVSMQADFSFKYHNYDLLYHADYVRLYLSELK